MNLDTKLGSGVNLVFATPILIRKMPNAETMNAGLRKAVLEAEAADAGSRGSNVGGWQSAPNFLDWPIPEIGPFKQWINDAIVHMASLPSGNVQRVESTAAAWVNLSRDGSYNRVHNHGDVHWSCVYYVDCGMPEPGRPMNGNIELRDPRPGATLIGEQRYPGYTFGHGLMVDPQPGLLLTFPGWVEHFVHPFFGKGERISIAVNVNIERIDDIVPR
jgi:uncharacterized protein (TIGR02466 family)